MLFTKVIFCQMLKNCYTVHTFLNLCNNTLAILCHPLFYHCCIHVWGVMTPDHSACYYNPTHWWKVTFAPVCGLVWFRVRKLFFRHICSEVAKSAPAGFSMSVCFPVLFKVTQQRMLYRETFIHLYSFLGCNKIFIRAEMF